MEDRLPYRSECNCACHDYPEGTMTHSYPCCTPDPTPTEDKPPTEEQDK